MSVGKFTDSPKTFFLNKALYFSGIKSSASTNFLPESSWGLQSGNNSSLTLASTSATPPSAMHPSASVPSFLSHDPLQSQVFDGNFVDSKYPTSLPGQSQSPRVDSQQQFFNSAQAPYFENFGAQNPGPPVVRNPAAPMLYNPEARNPVKVPEVAYHWFYKVSLQQRSSPLLMG